MYMYAKIVNKLSNLENFYCRPLQWVWSIMLVSPGVNKDYLVR